MEGAPAAQPPVDSPSSFRAESEASTAWRPLHLRSRQPSPPITPHEHPEPARQASTASSSPSTLRRSQSLTSSPALLYNQRSSEEKEEPPSESAGQAKATATAAGPTNRNRSRGGVLREDQGFHALPAHQRQLYRPEVRSCGHPQPIYLKVPLGQGSTGPSPSPPMPAPPSPQDAERIDARSAPPRTHPEVDETAAPRRGTAPAATTTTPPSLPLALSPTDPASAGASETQIQEACAGAGTRPWTHGTLPYAVESARAANTPESLTEAPLHAPTVPPNVDSSVGQRSPCGAVQGERANISGDEPSPRPPSSAAPRRFAYLCASSSSSSEGEDPPLASPPPEARRTAAGEPSPAEHDDHCRPPSLTPAQSEASHPTAAVPGPSSLCGTAASSDEDRGNDHTATFTERLDGASGAHQSDLHGTRLWRLGVTPVSEVDGAAAAAVAAEAAVGSASGGSRLRRAAAHSGIRSSSSSSSSSGGGGSRSREEVADTPEREPQRSHSEALPMQSDSLVDPMDVEELSDRDVIDADEDTNSDNALDDSALRSGSVVEVGDDDDVRAEEEERGVAVSAAAAVHATSVSVGPLAYALQPQATSPPDQTLGSEHANAAQRSTLGGASVSVAHRALIAPVMEPVLLRDALPGSVCTDYSSTEDDHRAAVHRAAAGSSASMRPVEGEGWLPALTIRHSAEALSEWGSTERQAHDGARLAGEVWRGEAWGLWQQEGQSTSVDAAPWEFSALGGGEENRRGVTTPSNAGVMEREAAASAAAAAVADNTTVADDHTGVARQTVAVAETRDTVDGEAAESAATEMPVRSSGPASVVWAEEEPTRAAELVLDASRGSAEVADRSHMPLAAAGVPLTEVHSCGEGGSARSTLPSDVEDVDAEPDVAATTEDALPPPLRTGPGVCGASARDGEGAAMASTCPHPTESLLAQEAAVAAPSPPPPPLHTSRERATRHAPAPAHASSSSSPSSSSPASNASGPYRTLEVHSPPRAPVRSAGRHGDRSNGHRREQDHEVGSAEDAESAAEVVASDAGDVGRDVLPPGEVLEQQQQQFSVASSRCPLVSRDLLDDVEGLSEVGALEDEASGGVQAVSWTTAVAASALGAAATANGDQGSMKPPSAPQQKRDGVEYIRQCRDAAAAADRAVLQELEMDGRRDIMTGMLEDRKAVLREEAAAYAVLLLTIQRHHRSCDVGANAGAQKAATSLRWQHQRNEGSPLLPPSPPAPTSRQEVQALLRTRGLPGAPASGIVSAAVFTDELLHREVIEDDEVRSRTMLRRLHQCEWDAFWSSSIRVHESLAWQRIVDEEQQDRQRVHALDVAVDDEVEGLRSIGRELAMCRVMEEEERREVIEFAEKVGRQRLLDLHWRGLAARLRQREALQWCLDLAFTDAVDDLSFEETQAREELTVEAIREWTALLESSSGTAIRRQQRQDQRRRSGKHEHAHRKAELQPSNMQGEDAAAPPRRSKRVGAVGATAEDVDVMVGLQTSSSDDSRFHAEGGEGVASQSSSAATPSVSIAAEPVFHDESSHSGDCHHRHANTAPQLFQWDPTSNSNPTTRTSNSHPSQLQQPPSHSHSAPSPSPHLTNVTALTITTTTTHTTPSSSLLAGNQKGATAVQAGGRAPGSSTESRRSPTTVLPTSRQLQAQEGIGPAEASALLHALQCAEKAAREQCQRDFTSCKAAAAATAAEHEGGRETGPGNTRKSGRHRRQYTGASVEEEEPRRRRKDETMRGTSAVDAVPASVEHAVEAPSVKHHRRACTTPPPSARRSPFAVTRHTIPCSLRHSPAQGYHALVRRYMSPRLLSGRRSPNAGSSPTAAKATASSSPSSAPLSAATASPRRYDDRDVYVYDAVTSRKPRSAGRVCSAEAPRFPWDASAASGLRVVNGEDGDISSDDNHPPSAAAASSAESPVMPTPARAVFPDRRSRQQVRDSIGSAALPQRQQQQPPAVIEVITDNCVPPAQGLCNTRDVSLSPLSSTGGTPSGGGQRTPFSHAAPTAAWTSRVEQRRLDRLGAMLLSSAKHGDDSKVECDVRMTPGWHNAGTQAEGEAYAYCSVDQCGCSRRRLQEPSGPLLITRLPFERGPGVWPSAPSERERLSPFKGSGAASAAAVGFTASPYIPARVEPHIVVTTSPPRRRRRSPAPTTLERAFEQATRAGDVVHLPTTVAELLRGPQHIRLPAPAPSRSLNNSWNDYEEGDGLNDEERGPEARRCSAQSHVQSPTPAPRCSSQPCYNYVDVFYKQLQRVASPQEIHRASPRPGAAVEAQRYVAERCAAVQACEVRHELREVLRPRVTPMPRATRVGNEVDRTGRVAESRHPRPSFQCDDGPSDDDAARVGGVECCFDDDVVVLCSALASQVKRERTTARRRQSQQERQQQQQPREVALRKVHARPSEQRMAPRRSPSPTAATRGAQHSRTPPQRHSSAPPPLTPPFVQDGYRVLRAPTPSYLQSRTPSQPQRAPNSFASSPSHASNSRHAAGTMPLGRCHTGLAPPTPATPLVRASSNVFGSPYESRSLYIDTSALSAHRRTTHHNSVAKLAGEGSTHQ
ncbi:hypothetical protein ABL78_4927 [Leptomonas seymouri]|uniref:Uncharacterized protein n=1 Tax=Leptomonas seymouri TaxID=5684 RepID=A0A0N1IJU4_LEPSE|nr:hypothetical protein ABL78_4927 [Leptomonas seymouri]|eukprot:KPI86024.1 hypothetical protein ABL78_4927 [Leptomonas seymouri]